MPVYNVTDPQTGRSLRLTGDSPPTEAELDEIFKSSAAAPVRGGLTHPMTSVFTKPEQAAVVGKILGHDVPVKPEDSTSFSDVVRSVKESPVSSAASAALGLTGLPAIYDFLKTAKEAGPDIMRGLASHPLETLRGGVAGTVEGAMEQATPLNALMMLLGRAKFGRVAEAPKAAEVTTTGARPVEPLVRPGAPAPSTGTAFPARAATKTPQPTAPVVETPPPPARVLEQPVTGGDRFMDALNPALGQEPLPAGKVNGSKVDTLTESVTPRRQVELLQKYGGKAEEGSYTQGTLDRFAEMMGQKGAKIDADVEAPLKAGNVDAAAQTIEKKVQELVGGFRQTKSSRGTRSSLPGAENLTTKDIAHVEQSIDLGSGQHPRITKIRPTKEAYETVESGRAERAQAYRDDAQIAARFRNALESEKGGVNPKLLAGIGGGAAGAAVGAAASSDEDRLQNAALGGAVGAFAVPLLAHAVASGSPVKQVQNFLFSSMLSSPKSILKAYLGGVGGAVAAATEQMAAGNVASGRAILGELFNRGFAKGIIGSLRKGAQTATRGYSEQLPNRVGQIYDAVNEPAMAAMEKGGIPHEDALRYTLTGVPRTQIGQDIVGLWNRYFVLKMLGDMFPRVGVQVLEHGLERSPAGLVKGLKGFKSLEGLDIGTKTGTAKAAIGTGTALASYMGSDQLPDWLKPFAVALSGVYGLPVGVGLAVGKAKDRGGDASARLQAGLDEAGQNLPFSRFGPAEAAKQVITGSSFVPGLVADVARARDPYERSTRGDFFGRTKAKIPGLRETLPVKGRNVNIAGEPTEDRSSPLMRFMTTASPDRSPMKGIPDRVVSELQRLDVQINTPSFQQKLKVGNREIAVPPDAAERAQTERRQYIVPQIEKMLDSGTYAKADDGRKKQMLQAVIRRAEAAGSARSRNNVITQLRQQGALRGSR